MLKLILPDNLAQEFDETKPVPLSALADYDYILLEEGLYSESMAEFEKSGVQPKMKLRLHDSFSTILMVEQGLGYTIMPMDAETEKLYQIKSFNTKPEISRTISLIQKNDGLLTNSAKNFINFVQKMPISCKLLLQLQKGRLALTVSAKCPSHKHDSCHCPKPH